MLGFLCEFLSCERLITMLNLGVASPFVFILLSFEGEALGEVAGGTGEEAGVIAGEEEEGVIFTGDAGVPFTFGSLITVVGCSVSFTVAGGVVVGIGEVGEGEMVGVGEREGMGVEEREGIEGEEVGV